jgi:hypothetical protein
MRGKRNWRRVEGKEGAEKQKAERNDHATVKLNELSLKKEWRAENVGPQCSPKKDEKPQFI